MRSKTIFLALLITIALTRTSAKNEIVDGHQYVDLGLPSGTLWATCNIGTNRPHDFGSFFSWGETQVKESTKYILQYYKHNNGRVQTQTSPYMNSGSNTVATIHFTKYCFDAKNGIVDKKEVLDSTDDVATVQWGKSWCMPTKEQFDELLKVCTWEFAEIEGHQCWKATGTNGNELVLPLSGNYKHMRYMIKSSVNELENKEGYYWTKTLYKEQDRGAYCLVLNADRNKCEVDFYDRVYGQSVRPVITKGVQRTISEKANSDPQPVTDNQEPNLTMADIVSFYIKDLNFTKTRLEALGFHYYNMDDAHYWTKDCSYNVDNDIKFSDSGEPCLIEIPEGGYNVVAYIKSDQMFSSFISQLKELGYKVVDSSRGSEGYEQEYYQLNGYPKVTVENAKEVGEKWPYNFFIMEDN
jgi:hypothetical protein